MLIDYLFDYTQDMKIPPHCGWMTNRLILGCRGCTHKFTRGVEEFDVFIRLLPVYMREHNYRCPSSKWNNKKHLTPYDVKVHLYKRGISCMLIGIALYIGRLNQMVE